MSILLYIKAASRWAIVVMTGGILAIAVSVYEHVKGKELNAYAWMCMAFLAIFIGGYLTWKEEHGNLTNEKLLGESAGPNVIIKYDYALQGLGHFDTVVDDPLQLQNVGDSAAYRIQIQPLSAGGCTAAYPLISTIQSGAAPLPVYPLVSNCSGLFYKSIFKVFLDKRNELFAPDSARSDAILLLYEDYSFPICVIYENVSGRKYRSTHEVAVNYGKKYVRISFVKREVIG